MCGSRPGNGEERGQKAMSKVHKVNPIQIGHDPEGTFIGLDSGSARYQWPTDKIPAIAKALRECAAGTAAPDDVNGMVFAVGERVALTDKSPKICFGNVSGQAGMVIETDNYSFVMPRRDARNLADGFDEVHRKLRP